jgi:PleD family two-component response regulator
MCYRDYEGEKAKRWSSNLEAKHTREMRLECRTHPSNLRDKGRIEMCMTKAKVDMVNKVWCKKAGASVTLSLKGETSLPAKMTEERKRDKMMIKRNEGKAHRHRIGEFCAKKKARQLTRLCCEMSPDCRLTKR